MHRVSHAAAKGLAVGIAMAAGHLVAGLVAPASSPVLAASGISEIVMTVA
jgi:hypothetical protein